MALPEILLIDDNGTRIQQIETVLRFLEYSVTVAGSADYEAALNDSDDIDAVFVGEGSEKQATLIRTIVEKAGDMPIFLLVDKGTQALATPVQQMLTGVLEWPTVYPLLIELLNGLPQRLEPPKKSQANKGLAGHSKAIQKNPRSNRSSGQIRCHCADPGRIGYRQGSRGAGPASRFDAKR